MSGTGKSTVLVELASRGYRVVDLDDDGWSVEVPTADAVEGVLAGAAGRICDPGPTTAH
jgi:hypothetical protein